MISQSFVISSQALALVQLDVTKKKLLKQQMTPLALGVVQRGLVQDAATFSQAIQALVGRPAVPVGHTVLVIPEDTVISKSLELPSLALKELNEAVNWEAERFLPLQKAQMVMDWEMLKGEGTLHVLFQAAPQVLIDRYLDIFDKLAISISAIETPALAMVRLAEVKPGVRVLIHISAAEATLTLARDNEVIATSVVGYQPGMDQILLKTVQSMQDYYRSFEIAWIQLGGVAVDTVIVKALSQLQVPVTGFALPFMIPAGVANQHLLGISAALKAIAPPDDQHTINLLPDWYVQREYYSAQRAYWKRFLQATVIYGVVLWLGMGGVFVWLLQQQKAILSTQQTTSVVVQQAQIEAAQTNQLSKQALALAAEDFFPFSLLTALANQKTDQIQLAKLQFSLSERKGLIQGIADNRLAMLAYKQAIEELPQIEQVQLPVSSFAEKEQIPFQLNIMLSTDLAQLETQSP